MNDDWLKRLLSEYGMLAVLLVLCLLFSVVTYTEQHPTGEAAARQLARDLLGRLGGQPRVLIAAREHLDDAAFAEKLRSELTAAGATVVDVVKGEPQDARAAFEKLVAAGERLDAIACNQTTATWLAGLKGKFPTLAGVPIFTPRGYRWPNFLKRDNLLNIANQIAVIAILAIGMTMVIIAGGIDLSVGSLIALSAVLACLGIRHFAGATHAGPLGMIACCLAGVAVCSLVGALSGLFVTVFEVPPFIVTLAMMYVARGVAYKLTGGESVYQVPQSFVWLGRGASVLGIPNAVLLMLLLYGAAHVLMSRTVAGRYLYAVGGNREAARLSGVAVKPVLLLTYVAAGFFAGLGGIVLASNLKSASPGYGQSYELYAIAAVVVGGTSLSGGEGKMFGTLIGAFIIAVIQNGMNLTNFDPFSQLIVFGLVILAAVVLDRLKHRKRC